MLPVFKGKPLEDIWYLNLYRQYIVINRIHIQSTEYILLQSAFRDPALSNVNHALQHQEKTSRHILGQKLLSIDTRIDYHDILIFSLWGAKHLVHLGVAGWIQLILIAHL